MWADSDDTFAYIVGYTSGGAPYGARWEEFGEEPPWVDEADFGKFTPLPIREHVYATEHY